MLLRERVLVCFGGFALVSKNEYTGTNFRMMGRQGRPPFTLLWRQWAIIMMCQQCVEGAHTVLPLYISCP